MHRSVPAGRHGLSKSSDTCGGVGLAGERPRRETPDGTARVDRKKVGRELCAQPVPLYLSDCIGVVSAPGPLYAVRSLRGPLTEARIH